MEFGNSKTTNPENYVVRKGGLGSTRPFLRAFAYFANIPEVGLFQFRPKSKGWKLGILNSAKSENRVPKREGSDPPESLFKNVCLIREHGHIAIFQSFGMEFATRNLEIAKYHNPEYSWDQ